MIPRMCRIVAAFPSLVACALLTGCGGSEPRDNENNTSRRAATTTAPAPVVIHMTGMVLIVPPKQGQNEVKVLLPALSNPQHAARLGFGMAVDHKDRATLCVDRMMVEEHGICYVDLTTWTWDAFGSGGAPIPTDLELPAGVLNATRISGTLHKVPTSTPANTTVVRLKGGWAAPTHCSLANWTYGRFDQQGQVLQAETQALVNVLDWEIDNLANPTLVFRRANPAAEIAVPILASENGRMAIILANIPTLEYKDLPPGRPTGLGQRPVTAEHFDAYYGLLADQNQQSPPPSRRPTIGFSNAVTTKACPVNISRPGDPGLVDGGAAIATYACIVASAEGS
jgi:hypothetical protein